MKTNTEFLAELCELGDVPPVTQVMIIQAIDSFTKRIAATPVSEFELMQDFGMIPARIWHNSAVKIQQALRQRLDGEDGPLPSGPKLV